MRIFLSWSGERSRAIADVLRQWLPSVVQASRPYFSPDDVTKGTRWSSEIAQELNESKLGLICLTRDNLSAPWLMFEAGAISKNIGAARVIPILFGVEPSDLVGPMTQFQSAEFSEEEIRRVVVAINSELGDQRLAPEVVQDVFNMWWPRLKERIEAIMKQVEDVEIAPARSEKDILEEVLALSRSLSRSKSLHEADPVSQSALADLLVAAKRLLNVINSTKLLVTAELKEALDQLERPLVYVATRVYRGARVTKFPVPAHSELTDLFAAIRQDDDDLPF